MGKEKEKIQYGPMTQIFLPNAEGECPTCFSLVGKSLDSERNRERETRVCHEKPTFGKTRKSPQGGKKKKVPSDRPIIGVNDVGEKRRTNFLRKNEIQ